MFCEASELDSFWVGFLFTLLYSRCFRRPRWVKRSFTVIFCFLTCFLRMKWRQVFPYHRLDKGTLQTCFAGASLIALKSLFLCITMPWSFPLMMGRVTGFPPKLNSFFFLGKLVECYFTNIVSLQVGIFNGGHKPATSTHTVIPPV